MVDHEIIRNKHEKLEGNGEASFDNPFMIQSHAESMKKIQFMKPQSFR